MVERAIEAAKRRLSRLGSDLGPYLRQGVRILALPYCYLFMVNWRDCPRSPAGVAFDLLYIFMRLGYFPDNYSRCRLWAVPRGRWKHYYGSGYNPFQRQRLRRSCQRPEYHILFEDKVLCAELCRLYGLPAVANRAVARAGQRLDSVLAGLDDGAESSRLIAKPVRGLGGRAILVCRREARRWSVVDTAGRPRPAGQLLSEDYVLQDFVQQHADLARFHERSLNTVRILTLLRRDGEPRVLSAFVRFGRGSSLVDNITAGGIACGVNPMDGTLAVVGYDKRGNTHRHHPEVPAPFASQRIPMWEQVMDLAHRIQRAFHYYPMLGLDIAVTPTGPLIVELNAFPDIVGQEKNCGPLLADPVVLREFAGYDLLTASMRRALRRDLADAGA